jgi:hypothetical protein
MEKVENSLSKQSLIHIPNISLQDRSLCASKINLTPWNLLMLGTHQHTTRGTYVQYQGMRPKGYGS